MNESKLSEDHVQQNVRTEYVIIWFNGHFKFYLTNVEFFFLLSRTKTKLKLLQYNARSYFVPLKN